MTLIGRSGLCAFSVGRVNCHISNFSMPKPIFHISIDGTYILTYFEWITGHFSSNSGFGLSTQFLSPLWLSLTCCEISQNCHSQISQLYRFSRRCCTLVIGSNLDRLGPFEGVKSWSVRLNHWIEIHWEMHLFKVSLIENEDDYSNNQVFGVRITMNLAETLVMGKIRRKINELR
jgi:hypothetical protein